MKTRTKKCGVFAALAAVLLVSAALVTSCPEALSFGGIKAPQNDPYADFVPPEGMGFIRFNVNVEKFKARTVLPGSAPAYATLASFGQLRVYISGGDGGTGYNNLDWDGSAVIPVNTSNTPYNITIVGFTNETTPVAIAIGTGTATVATSAGDTATITMKEIFIGTTPAGTPPTGTLTLVLDNTFDADTATMNIIGLTTNPTPTYASANTNVLPGSAGAQANFTLNAGYYQLELSVKKAGHADAIIREVAAIGSTLTTTYTKTLTLNPNVHTVTYEYHKTPSVADGTNTFVHGAAFAHPTDGAPSYTGYSFSGWFSAASAGTPYVIGTTKIIRPHTVHAQWTPSGSGDIDWDVDVAYGGTKDLVITATVPVGSPPVDTALPDPYSFDQDSPLTITFAVAVAAPDVIVGAVSYAWFYEGAASPLGTGATLAVPFGDPDHPEYLLSTGPQNFMVRVTDTEGTYTKSFNVQVTYTP